MKISRLLLAACACASFSAWAGPKSVYADKIAANHKISRTENWYGAVRTVFDFEGYEAWVVEPPEGVKPAAGCPWTWTMQWATAYVPRTSVPRLVCERGWRHATVITYKDRMDAHGLEVSRRFQKFLVDELGFAPKAHLIGMSWGGFYSIRYAAAFPECVEKIYLDCPLMSFSERHISNPATIGPWAASAPADGNWRADPRMPINLCGKVAAAKIPVLLLYGGQDQTLDPKMHAEAFIERFQKAGGDLRFTKRPLYGHHPHGVEINENTVIDFFCKPSAIAAERAAAEAGLERMRAMVTRGDLTDSFLHNPAAPKFPWLKDAPECVVALFTLRPTAESEIHCRLVLPMPGKWDGRFWGIGNQDVGKDIADWLFRGWQLPRVKAGSAACCADMGTANGRHGREVVKDFGWRAHHLMAVEAKKLVAEFYGRAAHHSYFLGLSSGGGQGLHEAQRFPEDYDGIVSYVPAHDRMANAVSGRDFWKATHGADGKLVVTKEQCVAVVDAALEWFASRGPSFAAGKMVVDPRYSEEAADGILALAAKKCPALASDDLRARWKRIWRKPVYKGREWPGGKPFGADASCVLGRRSFMSSVLSGPGSKFADEMTDAEFDALWAALGQDLNATDPDLSRFASRGGKLIVVSGIADPIVSCRSAWDYCERLAAKAGGADKLAPFFRAYFLPGRNHGGRERGRDGVSDVPSVDAIVKWCEKGDAPDALVGSLLDGTRIAVAPWPGACSLAK